VPLAVAVSLLLPLLVYQPSTGLSVPLAVAVPLLLPLLVYQPGTGLCVLLAVTDLLLLLGCGGHAVQIVPLAVSQP
jgi:riboflavin transporter FmnP